MNEYLKLIEENPFDKELQLIYSDWLEEEDPELAEEIRCSFDEDYFQVFLDAHKCQSTLGLVRKLSTKQREWLMDKVVRMYADDGWTLQFSSVFSLERFIVHEHTYRSRIERLLITTVLYGFKK